jgi:hypothetical protein
MPVQIGEASGYPVMYNHSEDVVYCKHVTVDADKLISAFDSTFDRVSLGPSLVMRKVGNSVCLGCLTLTKQIAEQIKINIRDERRNKINSVDPAG